MMTGVYKYHVWNCHLYALNEHNLTKLNFRNERILEWYTNKVLGKDAGMWFVLLYCD